MRIGIYAPNMATPAPSGVERYVTELVAALGRLESGHEFVMVTDADTLPASDRWRRVAIPGMGRLRRLLFDHRRLARLAADERLDLLHCTKSFVPAGLSCAGVMTVFDVIFLKYPEYYPAWWRAYWTRSLRRSVGRAKAILCISAVTARDLEEAFPAAAGKTRVAPLGVDRERFAAGDPPEKGRSYFLFVGNLTHRKNVPVLLDAFERISPKVDADLVVVGAPEYGADTVLERLRGGRVRHLPSVSDDELRGLYRGAIALVLPSQYEGFGLPALEAMAADCAVVASTGGALPEVVGEAGVTVAPGDVAALAAAMERVAEEDGLRDRLVAAGRERVAGFGWEGTARRTLEAYEEAARG